MSEERAIPLRSALTEPLVLAATCFTGGILLAHFATPSLAYCYSFASLALLLWIQAESTPAAMVFVLSSGCLLHHLQTEADRSGPFFSELESAALQVTVVGVVNSPPREIGSSPPMRRFYLEAEEIEHKGKRAQANGNRIYVSVRGGLPIEYGDRLELRGMLSKPRPARNPAEFDFANFLRTHGVYSELECSGRSVGRLAENQGNPVVAAGLRCREWLSGQITRGLGAEDDEAASIIRAMTLGAREDTPDYVEDKFRFSGTLHVFAVSGLHVGIVAAVVWFVASVLVPIFGLPRAIAVVSVIAAVISYAVVTGLRPSACRAAVMGAIFFGGMLLGREPQVFNSTGAAALVILLFDTDQLFRPGFQLSFCVLMCIAAMAGPIASRLAKPFEPDSFLPKSLVTTKQRAVHVGGLKLSALTGMSTAAWLGSSVLTWLYFGLVTPISIIANLLLVPIAFVVLGTAAFAVVLALIPNPLPAELANNANAVWVKSATAAAGAFSKVPGGHWNLPSPGNIWRGECEVTIFDLPYGGDAAHIALRGGGDWLIDSGSDSAFRRSVHPLLRSFGVGRLDGILLTHGDVDHVGGATTAIAEYRPRSVITTPESSTSPPWRAAITAAEQSGALLVRPRAGESIDLDRGHTLRILYPPSTGAPGFVADDRCLVVQLRLACGSRILFAADSGYYTERWLAENCPPDELRSDVLVQSRHDSDLSGLQEFIDAVSPKAIVAGGISRKSAGQRSDAWLGFLRHRDIAVFDQNQTGAVVIKSTETRIIVSPFLSGEPLEIEPRS